MFIHLHRTTSVLFVWVFAATTTSVQAADPQLSFVLDGFFKSDSSALFERGKGFGLGHTELSLHSAVDDLFTGRLTTVLESHEGATEIDIEEAFIDTAPLPQGISIRAGRFLSQVGYLNARHLHVDSFTERPAVYRALLGGHYFDDGIRLGVLLPTPFFWQLGVEALNGQSLAGGEGDDAIGVVSLKSKWGGDLGESNSWQAGISFLKHHLTVPLAEEATVENEGDEHNHDHSHDAAYSGENMLVLDAVWKWAPRGNPRERQLSLSAEYLFVDELGEFADEDDFHEGWYAAAVYRFQPQWSAGLRYGEVDLQSAHGDHFHAQSLRETDLVLSWSRSHFSQLRLQYSIQDAEGFDDANDTLSLQYVMTLGAHGAHEF
jgi:hypothetical protein